MVRTKQVRKKSSIVQPKRNKASSIASSNESISSISSIATLPPNLGVMSLVNKEYDSTEQFIEELEEHIQKQREAYTVGYMEACEIVRQELRNAMEALPSSLLDRCIDDEISEDLIGDQNKDPNMLFPKPKSLAVPKARQSRPTSRHPVQSFEFKKPKTPRKSSRSSSAKTKRSVSATAVSRKNDSFHTPAMNSRHLMSSATITPKIYSDSPMSVMRRPYQNEIAVSMSGSPLMVGAVSSENMPTVNVPMQDGRVFSIMPQEGAPPPDLPDFDETTKNYLKTLRAHLAILAPSTP